MVSHSNLVNCRGTWPRRYLGLGSGCRRMDSLRMYLAMSGVVERNCPKASPLCNSAKALLPVIVISMEENICVLHKGRNDWHVSEVALIS